MIHGIKYILLNKISVWSVIFAYNPQIKHNKNTTYQNHNSTHNTEYYITCRAFISEYLLFLFCSRVHSVYI